MVNPNLETNRYKDICLYPRKIIKKNNYIAYFDRDGVIIALHIYKRSK